jgi:hypothetical protein
MGKRRGKKLAAELLLKAIANKKLKRYLQSSRILWSRKTKGLTNSLILKILKRQRT